MYKLQYDHLRKFSSSEGYWSTIDCIKVANSIIDITKANSMLEIGFNIGYSAATWIQSGIKTLYIIDINYHPDTEAALHATKETFTDVHVDWLLANSTHQIAKDWIIPTVDMAFIDGEHTYEATFSDSMLSIEKGAKWLAYDDVIEGHSNGIHAAIVKLEEQGLIDLIQAWPMTWTEQGYVVLVKVL
jgi:predicted O-methyltransferase YrrM